MELVNILLSGVKNTAMSALTALNGASGWLIISFFLAGILHNLLSPGKFQHHLGNRKISSLIKATISGMFLPICSCGVIPIGISMYYSGAYLGPVLAFMTSTPVINPIAIVLSMGLLGPKITIIYVLSGFFVPMIVGVLGNVLGGSQISINGDNLYEGEKEETDESPLIELEEEHRSLSQKLIDGIRWSFEDLALTVSKYVVLGMLCAGFINTVFPSAVIHRYLGSPDLLSLGSIAVLACIMYVCAIGHIPFIAALVASGAAPGVAITFLIAGAATNLPELISISKVIGKKTAAIYSLTLVTASIIIGYITNLMVPSGYSAIAGGNASESIKIANSIMLNIPEEVSYICTAAIIVLALAAVKPKIRKAVSVSE